MYREKDLMKLEVVVFGSSHLSLSIIRIELVFTEQNYRSNQVFLSTIGWQG